MEKVFERKKENLRVMLWKQVEDWLSGRDSVSHSADAPCKKCIELVSGTEFLRDYGQHN